MRILGERDVTLRRCIAATTRSEETGRAEIGPYEDRTIRMSVQPLGGNDLALLPEGERSANQRKGYTKENVRTADQYGELDADLVVVDDIVYRCMQVEQETAVIAHRKVRLVRIAEGSRG